MTEAYIGAGSNIEPERNLVNAIESLRGLFGSVTLSNVYRNPPVGFAGDDFLNLVLRVDATEGPGAAEQLLTDLESRAGRTRTETAPGPRTLDLDLLLYGSLVDADSGIPHTDILRYSFVLCPLAELAPDLVHPVTGVMMRKSWTQMAKSSPPMTTIGTLTPPDAEAASVTTA